MSAPQSRIRPTHRIWLSGVVLLGATALLVVIVHAGLPDVITAFHRAGWMLIVLAPLHVLTVGLDSQGWRGLLRALDKRIARPYLVWAAAVRNATQSLVPIGIGDIVSGARLLRIKRIALATGIASLVAEDSLMILSELVFVLVGIAVYALLFPASGRFLLVLGPILGVDLVAVALIIWAQVDGRLLGKLAAAGKRILDKERHEALLAAPLSIQNALRAIYRRRKVPLQCIAWQVASFFSEAAELWIIMLLMRVPASFYFALLLQSLGRVARSVTFVIPAGLGIQEGVYAFLAPLGGLSPGFGIALSLATRFRDISFGVPVLVSWQIVEVRLRRARKRVP